MSFPERDNYESLKICWYILTKVFLKTIWPETDHEIMKPGGRVKPQSGIKFLHKNIMRKISKILLLKTYQLENL